MAYIVSDKICQKGIKRIRLELYRIIKRICNFNIKIDVVEKNKKVWEKELEFYEI